MSAVWDVALLFLRLGLVAFGAGSSVLSEMERETVARGWMTHTQFVQAFAVSQLTPGPQVLYTTIIGYFAAGFAGAAVATIAFCLPPAIITVALATVWTRPSQSPWPDVVRRSLGPVAIGLIAASTYTLAPAALNSWWAIALAVGCFALLQLTTRFSPLWVIITGAVVGAAVGLVVGG